MSYGVIDESGEDLLRVPDTGLLRDFEVFGRD